MIIVVKENEKGKIELTKEELEELLKKAEDEGRKSSSTITTWPKNLSVPTTNLTLCSYDEPASIDTRSEDNCYETSENK